MFPCTLGGLRVPPAQPLGEAGKQSVPCIEHTRQQHHSQGVFCFRTISLGQHFPESCSTEMSYKTHRGSMRSSGLVLPEQSLPQSSPRSCVPWAALCSLQSLAQILPLCNRYAWPHRKKTVLVFSCFIFLILPFCVFPFEGLRAKPLLWKTFIKTVPSGEVILVISSLSSLISSGYLQPKM